MTHSGTRQNSALALAVASVLAGAAAAAPARAAATSDGLEEVIVTATRRAENILDVPYNITAVSGAQIEKANVFDSVELLRSIPGVATVDRGQRNSSVVNGIRIRGLNVDSSALGDYAISAVSTVSTYVDDTPVFANLLLKDIDRVEVLRGPQGTLYGSGALGGTVRYVLTEPQLDTTSAKVAGTFSQVNGSDGVGLAGDVTFNVPIGQTFAVRGNLSRADYPGITDYVNLYRLDSSGIPVAPNGVLDPAASYYRKKDADTVDIWYGRLAAKWQPSEGFDATLSYFHQDDDVGGRRQPTPGFDGYGRRYHEYENGSIQLEPATRQVDMGTLEANVDLGFATLTSSTSYYDHSGDSTSENTGFYAQAGFLAFYYYYPRPMASAVRTYSDKAFIQEFRLVSKGGETFDWVAGLYYQDQKLQATQDSYLRGFKRWWDAAVPSAADAVTGDQDFLYRRDDSFKDKAAYGELTWHATDKLAFTGGVRYFDNSDTNRTLIDIPLYASLSQPTRATFKSSEDKFLFKGNVALSLGDDELLYATISEGYRRGGSNAVPLTGFFAESPLWQVYKADTVTNYEVGLKGTVGRLRYDASVFYIDWQDPQLSTATPNWGFYVTTNGDSAESKGIELQLSGQLTDRIGFGLGYTWNDAALRSDFVSPLGAVIEVDGAQLPGAPKQIVNAFLDYNQPLNDSLQFTARVGAYYQSETQNALSRSPVFDATLDSFQIWDASATLAGEKWSAALWVKNIGNSAGITGVFKEEYMGTAPDQGYYGNGAKNLISLPRTFGLTLTYEF